MSTAFVPEIAASNVAALIGLNPYRKPYEAMYAILKKSKAVAERIRALETQHKRQPIEKARRLVAADPDVRKVIQQGLDETKTNPDIPTIVEQAAVRIGVIAALRFPNLPEEKRMDILKEVASEIHKLRGNRNEKAVLDDYEKDTGDEVTERNTRMARKAQGPFTLLGRIDGFVASKNRIVDSKERTQQRAEIPIQDEIQMRVYMDLLSCPESELVERFPTGEKRRTVWKNEANKWGAIYQALLGAVHEMGDAVQDEAALLRIIEANTFTEAPLA